MARIPRRPEKPADSMLEKLMSDLDARLSGSPASDTVPTGFPSLDRKLAAGLRRKDLVVLGGDVGSGKSALGLGIAIRAAAAGVPTLYFSGEMSPERVMERALAIEGRTSIDDLRQGQLDDATRSAVGAAALKFRAHALAIRPLLGADPEEIRSALDMVPRSQLLVIDSLQLTAPPRPASRLEERVALAVRALKALAVERDLVVLVTGQLSHHQAS